MLRYAVVYKDDNIYCEIPENDFVLALERYYHDTGDLVEAFAKLRKDLEYKLRRL